MPGDVALVGTLFGRALEPCNVVIEGNSKIRLDQSVSPARGHVVVPGSLHVKGDLGVVARVVVCGDLVVDGVLSDCGPQSIVVVLGSVRCRSLLTTGEVLVAKDLIATTLVWAQGNDNVLEVGGTLRTAVLMSDDHAIEAGKVEVAHRPPTGGTWAPLSST
jgi:hypothetical protein